MTIALVIVGLVVAYFAAPLAYMRWLRGRAAARAQQGGGYVLTFDDGPNDRMTDRLLDVLDNHEARVAHFFVTAHLDQHAAQLQRARERGDLVGCHGHRHVHHWKSLPWAGVLDIRASWRRYRALTGEDGSKAPFRPPYGKLNLLSLLYLLWHRTPIAAWTIDGGDTAPGFDASADAVLAHIRGHGGGIVLLHDYNREDERANDVVMTVVDTLLRESPDGGRVESPTAASFS